MKRLILLLFSKIKSIFKRNIAFSARVEYSEISPKARWETIRMWENIRVWCMQRWGNSVLLPVAR